RLLAGQLLSRILTFRSSLRQLSSSFSAPPALEAGGSGAGRTIIVWQHGRTGGIAADQNSCARDPAEPIKLSSIGIFTSLTLLHGDASASHRTKPCGPQPASVQIPQEGS